jgi:membrane associated rhomboid family serine protease
MGESDRYLDYKQNRHIRLGDDGNALVALFAINIIFFLLILLIEVSFHFSESSKEAFINQVLKWFWLPGSFESFIKQPWSIVTYMFSDSTSGSVNDATSSNIIRFIVNMVWLWGFGRMLQQAYGNNKLIPIYIYGGLVGGLFFMLAHAFIPSLSETKNTASLLGANTGVLAIAMATTTLVPNYRFFTQIRNGIPLWVLMIIFILIDLAGIAGKGAAFVVAHIGALLAGFLFIILMRKGYDGSTWMNKAYHSLINMFTPSKNPSREKIREKVFYETGNRKPFTKTAHITQQRIDEILDKINQKGYHFLTDEEKDILKKAADEKDL